MKLSDNFDLDEFIFSSTAVRLDIDNTPDVKIISNLRDTCIMILEPLRKATEYPIKITSGYRCWKLNNAIGGSQNSQHIVGEAVDIKCKKYTTEELFQLVIKLDLPFDQLIQEFDNWVHISYSNRERKQILRAVKKNGLTIYEKVLL